MITQGAASTDSDGQSFAPAPLPRAGEWLRLGALAALAGTISMVAFVLSLAEVHLAAGLLACAAVASAAWPRPSDAATPPALSAVWGLSAGFCALIAGASLDPIVEAGFRCGTGDVALVILGSPVVFGSGAIGFLVARKVLGARASRPWTAASWLRFAIWLAGLVLVVGATERRMSHPAPEGYLESLPVVARIRPPSQVPCQPQKQPSGNTVCIGIVREVGPLVAEYECPTDEKQPCRLDVTPTDGDPIGTHQTELYVGRDEAVRVRRDASEGLYLLESGGVARRAVRDQGELVFFLRPGDVGHSLGAPSEWIALGAAGLVVAAALAWLANRRGQVAARLASARTGVLGASGWVELADGAAPVLVAPMRWTGPVTVLGTAPAPGYRSARQALEVARGAPEELAARELAWARSARTAALSVFALCLAPLIAALGLGLAL
jgi:hypothetical protein